MKNELIDEIKAGIQELDYSYPEGAWEKFQQHKKRQEKPHFKLHLFLLRSAAILIPLLLISIFFADLRLPIAVKNRKNLAAVPAKPQPVNDPVLPTAKSLLASNARRVMHSKSLAKDTLINKVIPAAATDSIVKADQLMASMSKQQPVENTFNPGGGAIEQSESDLYKKWVEPYVNLPDEEAAFRFSVHLSQGTWSGLKSNPSIGAAITYVHNKQISIRFGVAYYRLFASKNIEPPLTVNEKSFLASDVSAKLSGIELPLEFQYRLSKKWQITAGLSLYTILRDVQKRNYTYVVYNPESLNSNNGEPDFRSMFTATTTSSLLPAPEKDNRDYLGFYNLSISYQLPISANNQLGIEPYLRLPMNGYTGQKVDLSQTGLRVRLIF